MKRVRTGIVASLGAAALVWTTTAGSADPGGKWTYLRGRSVDGGENLAVHRINLTVFHIPD